MKPVIASLADLKPYPPGKSIETVSKETGITKLVKLASNENLMGPSQQVLSQWQSLLDGMPYYPNGEGPELKTTLAKHWDIPSEQLIIGAGSDEVIDLLFRAYVGPGDEVVIPRYSFPSYSTRTHAVGGTIMWADMPGYQVTLSEIESKMSDKTKLVCIANPNNPTGTLIPFTEIKRFLDSIPTQVLVLLDEAYYEYLPDDLQSKAHEWIKTYPNLVVTRSFSKIYGLGAMRLGYGMAQPDLLAWMQRLRLPFNTTRISQALGVLALSDQTHVQACFALNLVEREKQVAALEASGYAVLPTHANFVCIQTGPHTQRLYNALLQAGYITRPLSGFGLADSLRVTIGLPEHNQGVMDVLARESKNL